VFKDLHTKLVDPNEPRAYNYAMLDLAALVCTKVRPPDCHRCPVKPHCRYGNDPHTAKAT
jgi:adenine-specific DNA glycosylase